MHNSNTVTTLGVLAAAASTLVAYLLPVASPVLIGTMISFFGVNEAVAGQIISIELFAMGITCLASVPLLTRFRFSTIAGTGGVLVIICNLLSSAVGESLVVFSILRAIAGAGAGLLLASVNAMIARTPDPSSLYGKATAIALVAAALAVLSLPTAISLYEFRGAYLLMAAVVLLVLPLIFRLPNLKMKIDSGSGQALGHRGSGLQLLAVTALVNLASVAFYAFIERMGVRLGMDLDTIAVVLALNALAGIIASIVVALTGERFGITLPLLIAISALAATIAGGIYTDNYWLFAICAIIQGFAVFLFYSYILGLAASLDKSGRWASITASVYFLSGSFGPFVGGFIIAHYSYQALGRVALGCFLVAAIILGVNTKMSEIKIRSCP